MAEDHLLIRECTDADRGQVCAIINDAAMAYQGTIPADCWHVPYLSFEALESEIAAGVCFWGGEVAGVLSGVMGIQQIRDVSLIRHAYVRSALRQKGIGSGLLRFLLARTDRPVLVGTWQDAFWAVRFYQKHGFCLVTPAEKDDLLRTYWRISERQREVSVVLADRRWYERHQ